MIEVRPAGPGDAAVVHRLTQAAFAGQERLTPPSGAVSETEDVVRAQLAARPGAVAYVAGEPAGAYRLEEHADGTLHIRRMSVDPAFRGRGVARAMVEHAEGVARAEGRAELRAGVRDELPDNLALFRHLGYAVVTEHPFWYELTKELGVTPESPARCATPLAAPRGVVLAAGSAAVGGSSALRSTATDAARDGRDPGGTP